MVRATVPTDVPREPLPVTVTVGTIVRAKLSVIASDATVTPLDTIDKSIGDDVSILLSWQVQPTVTTETGVGGWAHGVLDAVKNYWVQLTALLRRLGGDDPVRHTVVPSPPPSRPSCTAVTPRKS